MKTKRVFFALMATLLLPLTVMAQDVTPTPAPGTAVIAVSVFFNNGNTGDSVGVKLQCSGGTISPTDVKVIDPMNGLYQHAFVVESIPLVPGAEEPGVDCWLTQTDSLIGYDTYYNCLYGEYADWDDANPDPACAGVWDDEFCHWTDVQPNDAAGCVINNYAEYQDVDVTKKWDIIGTGGDTTNRDAEITITCNSYIQGGTSIGGGYYRVYEAIDNGDYDADGEAVVSASVFPWWYPEGSVQGNFCYASEFDVDSAVEVESDCGNYSNPGMEVSVGSGDSCTITNTVFFEGIPTLNQYGMAIMALLMLGVGFVGFRRFV